MFIFKSNMDKDFDQTCEYILKLKRAELFFHGIKKQDKTKARLYHATLEYYCLLYTSPSPRDDQGNLVCRLLLEKKKKK